jgi:colanic acid biosynthesis glycosyl transferase WcaI
VEVTDTDPRAGRPRRILLLGINYAPEKIGIAVYSTGLARALAAAGHQVRVVTAKPYYPDWRVPAGMGGWRWLRAREADVEVLRCPIYVPRVPDGKRRLIHHASFALAAGLPMLKRAMFWRPDLVVTVAPSLVSAPLGWLAARVGGGAAWLHIQDFELDAAFATGLIGYRPGVARWAKRLETGIFRLFDRVSSISPQMCARLIAAGIAPARVTEFRNWSNIDRIIPLDRPSEYRAQWDIVTPHVALYSGNIANKQGIEIVVEAARLLAHRRDLTFVICGQGPNRAALEALIAGQDNVRIHDLQPEERLGELLGLATIHLLPQKAGAADLVMPSKLPNMLASGRPVVATAAPGTAISGEVASCGIVSPPEDAPAFAAAIEALMDDPDLWRRSAAAARMRAQSLWGREQILEGAVQMMITVAANRESKHDAA